MEISRKKALKKNIKGKIPDSEIFYLYKISNISKLKSQINFDGFKSQ